MSKWDKWLDEESEGKSFEKIKPKKRFADDESKDRKKDRKKKEKRHESGSKKIDGKL